jgi:transcriptional regulator with XRE-family HTH domain
MTKSAQQKIEADASSADVKLMPDSQIPAWVRELKRALKAAGKTYADVARQLEVSEPSVKRTFSLGNFTLDRFEQVCLIAGITMHELLERASERPPAVSRLTNEQEEELFGNIRLLLIANLVLNHWKFAEILEHFEFDQHELIHLLARLDKMRMIELLPGNDVRLLVSRQFSWRPNGPVQRFFNQFVQKEFFDTLFDKPGERLVFLSGMLSRTNLTRFHQSMQKLAEEFDEMTRADSRLSLNERHTTSLVVALRPWAFPPFARYRRKPSGKKLE